MNRGVAKGAEVCSISFPTASTQRSLRLSGSFLRLRPRDYLVPQSDALPSCSVAWAAASRAIGTRNGEQLT